MAKLNQILAIEKGVRSQNYAAITELNKDAQREHLWDGFSKTYQPLNAEDAELPPERKKVALNYVEIENAIKRSFSELIDITARKDWTNLQAVADVRLDDGTVLIEAVPTTHLLFLEKQLADLQTLVGNIPVLDFSEDWDDDSPHRANAHPSHPQGAKANRAL